MLLLGLDPWPILSMFCLKVLNFSSNSLLWTLSFSSSLSLSISMSWAFFLLSWRAWVMEDSSASLSSKTHFSSDISLSLPLSSSSRAFTLTWEERSFELTDWALSNGLAWVDEERLEILLYGRFVSSDILSLSRMISSVCQEDWICSSAIVRSLESDWCLSTAKSEMRDLAQISVCESAITFKSLM